MLRAMLLEVPGDPACETLDRQYMLGDSVLAAPVFSPHGEVSYYVPAGRWTSLLDGRVVEGRRWVQERHGYQRLPLLARPGSVIPLGNNDRRPDYDYSDGITLQAYQLEDGSQVEVPIPSPSGEIVATFIVERQGLQVTVTPPALAKPWQLFLAGMAAVGEVENGAPSPGPHGALVTPDDPGKPVVIYLKKSYIIGVKKQNESDPNSWS